MEFLDSYFEDEVREGFYIPSLMKRAWAAQMEVLEIVQNICEKHHIRYFAEWGTLLGTIRHGGRIPWDDDIDICMLRDDYEKFCRVAEKELPEECWFLDHRTSPGFTNMLGRVINSRVHVQEGKYLEKYHGFPYVAGIDIFWLDDLPGEGEITNLPVWESNHNYRLPKRCYESDILLPYENGSIRVPVGYDELLVKKYGEDWMKPVHSGGSHDYPSYAKQQKFLESEQAAELYEYKFSLAEMGEVEKSRQVKETLQKKIREFVPLFGEAHEEIRKGIANEEYEVVFQVLGDCQNVAIQIGTMIEQEKGEGHPTVKLLEQYCETIFQIHTELSQGQMPEIRALSDFEKNFQNSIEQDLREKKVVVFVPYKASLWGTLGSVWQAAMQEEDTEVYVIPTPYYYKDAFGKAKTGEPQYETEGYPENVVLTNYEDFDFQARHPDLVVIQCPYDEYNYGMTVHPFFYAKNLKKYTDKLVYIPAFLMDEIGPGDDRARETLKSYCNMPGVVYADKVIVQSEQMKDVYVELLTEFAGEGTKGIWENKITSLDSPIYD